jgi:prolyl oligopeptidase
MICALGLAAVGGGLCWLAGCSGLGTSRPVVPPSRTAPVVDVYHGVEVADPYRWVEDQESPETRRWIDRENAYTDAVLGPLPGREALRRRFAELLAVGRVTVPDVRGERTFYERRRADDELFAICLREGTEGEEQVLIDPHPWSPDRTTSVDLLDVSRDGRLLAYAVRQGGADETEVRLFDVDGRRDLPDVLARDLYFGTRITPDGAGLYYTRQTDAGPRVFHHQVGSDPARDQMVYGEGYGPEKLLFADVSEDGRYLLVNVLYGSSADHTEVYLEDLRGGGGWQTVVADLDSRTLGTVAGGRLYLRTNWRAPNGRVLVADLAVPGDRSRWREVVPERPAAVIEDLSLAAGRLFVSYVEDVHSRVAVFAPDGAALGEIGLDTLGSVDGVQGEWNAEEVFFRFTSFAVPPTIYGYRVATAERREWYRTEVPIDPRETTVEQVWFTSRDGTRVPMFLVHRQVLERDGSRPALLTGYGGFNVSLTPFFSAAAAVWAEHGGVYAVANLRGGGELGEAWHRAGMREAKQNVFDDFIAAAEWLVAQGYTRPDKLAISGGSNGGLLVGAAMTQRPDLFRAVVCSYPLLDMLRYQRFLLGPYWVPEYGSADESPEMFEALRAYSPYHHVRAGTRYPAVLFVSGDGDTRVAPLHARKMAALMQTVATRDRPALLRYHTKAGHSGGEPVSEQVEDLAENISFLLWQLGAS